MAQLPSSLINYRLEAEKSLQEGLVKDIEFSGSTYQTLIEDRTTREQFWVFMQLEGRGQIKDVFCSCEASSQDVPCLHQAVAYLSLFGSYQQPLHQRFARSLWNELCRLHSDRLGDDPSLLTKLQPGYYVYQANDRVIYSLKATTDKAIERVESLLGKRPQETEETSLEFSNLPFEEIQSWREGKPSPQLRYNISYWSDLAKWLLKNQEEGMSYDISFQYSKKGLPNWIHVQFPDLTVGFALSETQLSSIVSSLATVKSPLAIHTSSHQKITHIAYDKRDGCLQIEADRPTESLAIKNQSELGIELEDWFFFPGDGFYAKKPHELLETPFLKNEELSAALSAHTRLISSLLTEYAIHSDPFKLSYTLKFDKNWALHLTAYLFEPGDLTQGDSRLINQWAFLDDDGFYRIEGKRFEELETTVPIQHVGDFVTQNRAWLNTMEGFHIHVKSLEYQLSYQITSTNRLVFSRSLAKAKEGIKIQDFGPWVYVEGHGFYSKTSSSFSFLLRPGISLSPEQIPLFIKMNQDELSLIPHFFSHRCPVSKVGLRVELNKTTIKVSPDYQLLKDYSSQDVRFFDDFVYIEEEGFYELPLELRLPEKFRHEVEIENEEEKNLFLIYELEEIKKHVSYLDPYLEKSQELSLTTHAVFAVPEKGRGWYSFAFNYRTEKGLIPIRHLYQAVKKKQHFAFFEAGLIDLQDKRFDWLRQIKKDRFDKTTGTILLTTLEFMRLNAFDNVHLLEDQADAKTKELMGELTQLHTPDEPDIEGLTSHLRPYQEIGVHWLWFLYNQGLSGLLCDDMGLGKTHQTMALLASISNFYRHYAEGASFRFLIVCPTSVIYHWQEKLQHFLPAFRVYTFYGSNRNLDEFQEGKYEVLLTSYGILRNERELLSKIKFEVAIFDEIQIAKNQLSRVYSALLRIRAQMKLGLTGTPIENHLRELKSLFDIVLPSYFPGELEYREFFVRPIEKDHSSHRKDLLNRIIKPFVLRRKKEDVLKDLPEKIEEIAYCDLLPYQYQLYSEALEQRRRHLIDELENDSGPIPYLHVFALLSSLKQICDHPAVYLKDPNQYQKYSSGKWDLFVELLREARESQQKVVVFSQYLNMLDIIENYLTEQGIGFSSLRGSTQNRKFQIQQFNQVPSCEVFVGSLHAAGLGVDLTAGSVVIHYDRWWNAARENQATDRVHRIGQTRGVQVFKLVTKGTFEEKIDRMIERKGKLMEEVIGTDDQNTLKRFTRDELVDLLSLVETSQEHLSDSD